MKTLTAVSLALALALAHFAQKDSPPSSEAPADNVMEVTARGLVFEAPDEVPSGWTTVRLTNASDMAHFAIVQRLPEGIGVEDHQRDLAPLFQEGMDLLAAGEFDAANEKFGELPSWFGDIVFLGGPGLVTPGRTAEATVFLEPGRYLLECYVTTVSSTPTIRNPTPTVWSTNSW